MAICQDSSSSLWRSAFPDIRSAQKQFRATLLILGESSKSKNEVHEQKSV